jgi:hypothetical protein
VMLSSGMGSEGRGAMPKHSREEVLDIFRHLGVPEELVVASGIAAAKTREPITLMVPLISLAAAASKSHRIQNYSVPPLAMAGEVPLNALDEHTGLGREAIWRFAAENNPVRSCLERFVLPGQRRRAANVAAFYTDAAPVARRLVWDQSTDLEAFGIERDLLVGGVPIGGIVPLLQAVRANLGHLNAIRAEVLNRSSTASTQDVVR